MKRIPVNPSELSHLRQAHRRAKNKRDADRIKAVYSLLVGYSLKEVSDILMLDEETVRSYQKQYKAGGVTQLLRWDYKGSACCLSSSELERLRKELETQIHLTTQSVIAFVKLRFKVEYMPSGMRDLLHRIGYEYKKPKLVPGNPDKEAQVEFAQYYEDFMQTKAADVEVLFGDAVHPEHNTLAAYGWIKRGQRRELKTNSGRQRLNLHGAINAETYHVTLIESETVNADSTLNLLTAIENAYPASKEIHLILDNARYHYSKLVKEFLKTSRINLVFLPSYSPNLNLIERLWKFFKKMVLYNRYYENVKEFRKACIRFFRNIDDYHEQIHAFMAAEFELPD